MMSSLTIYHQQLELNLHIKTRAMKLSLLYGIQQVKNVLTQLPVLYIGMQMLFCTYMMFLIKSLSQPWTNGTDKDGHIVITMLCKYWSGIKQI